MSTWESLHAGIIVPEACAKGLKREKKKIFEKKKEIIQVMLLCFSE